MVTLVSLLLAVAIQQPEIVSPISTRQSAQCLMEVAALSNETFPIWDESYRAAAQAKFDRIVEIRRAAIDAREGLAQAQADFLAELQADEAEGRAPPGTTDVAKRQLAEELFTLSRPTEEMDAQLPSCEWE